MTFSSFGHVLILEIYPDPDSRPTVFISVILFASPPVFCVREIICLVVRSRVHACKAFERVQFAREMTGRIIPNVECTLEP